MLSSWNKVIITTIIIMTDVALFNNASTILVLLEINDKTYLQCCWNPRLNKNFVSWLVDFSSRWKGNDQEPIQSNSNSTPDTSSREKNTKTNNTN